MTNSRTQLASASTANTTTGWSRGSRPRGSKKSGLSSKIRLLPQKDLQESPQLADTEQMELSSVRLGRYLLAAMSAVALMPSTSLAAGAKLSGQVVGTPYTAGGQTAVPVLLTSNVLKRAHLASPSGVFLMSSSRPLSSTAGAIKPSALHVGDVFSATATVPRSERSAAFFRFGVKTLRVTRRTGTPTPAELQQQISSLGTYVAQIASAQNKKLSDLASTANWLYGQSATLQGLLATLQKSLGNMSPAQIQQLVTDLTGNTQRITTLEQLVGGTDVVALKSSLDGVIAELGSVPSGQTLQGQLNGLTGSLSTVSGLLGSVPSGQTVQGQLSGLTSSLSTTNTSLGNLSGLLGSVPSGQTLQGQLNGVTSSLSTVSGLLGSVPSGQTVQGQLNGLTSSVSTVSGLLGSVPSGQTLQGQLNTVSGLLGSVPSGQTLQGQLTSLSGSFGTVSNQVGYLCNSSTKLLTGVLNLGILGIGGTAACPS